MLASGYINPLGDGTRSFICLIHDLIVEANHPLSDGSGAECDCIHLDMALILPWFGALQPNAGDRAILVVISISRTAASRSAASPRIEGGVYHLIPVHRDGARACARTSAAPATQGIARGRSGRKGDGAAGGEGSAADSAAINSGRTAGNRTVARDPHLQQRFLNEGRSRSYRSRS